MSIIETNDIRMSILKGDKLLNENTPFVINLSAPQPNEDDKKCNVDLICVIDISGSMSGEKIYQVKESLKILISLMDEKDRLCLILFESSAQNYYNLSFLTKKNKENLEEKINQISSYGGTDILSGLKMAVDVIKSQTYNEKRVSSILLLSDGCDNKLNDVQIANSFKNLTKNLGISFTLHTFGYGDDHDAKIMNKLANLRDGSFFYVKEYSKVAEYFVSVLGGCISVISKKLDLKLQVLNNYCKIIKAYGAKNLYSYKITNQYFQTTLLQFICGKEYTFVLDIFVDESKVQIGEELLKLEISYEDIEQNNKKIHKEIKYKYELKDSEYEKANEEFIRAYVYSVLDEAIKLKDENENEKGKKLLEDLEKWLSKNDKQKIKQYIKEINDAKNLFSEFSYDQSIYNNLNCCVQNNMFKKMNIYNNNCNNVQMKMINSIPIKKNQNQNKLNINNNAFDYNNFNQYPMNKNSAPSPSNVYNSQFTNVNNDDDNRFVSDDVNGDNDQFMNMNDDFQIMKKNMNTNNNNNQFMKKKKKNDNNNQFMNMNNNFQIMKKNMNDGDNQIKNMNINMKNNNNQIKNMNININNNQIKNMNMKNNGQIIEKIYENGRKYIGQFKNGIREGYGIMFFPDGGRYEGNWENGLAHGKGIEYYKNGDRFEGEYYKDEEDGEGVYYYSNGDRLMGNYRNGNKIGKHVKLCANGQIQVFNFNN